MFDAGHSVSSEPCSCFRRAASHAPLHWKSLLQPVKTWSNCISPDNLTTLHQTGCLLWEEATEERKNSEGCKTSLKKCDSRTEISG